MNQSRHVVLLQELERLAARVVGEVGLELVELSVHGSSQRRVLRLDVDRAGPVGVRLEDCQQVSKRIGDALEESEVIQNSYVLEVSSPGIDRPIKSDHDIRRNTGRRVLVETSEPIEGRDSFTGILAGGDAEWLELNIENGSTIRLPRRCIRKACQELSF